MTIGHSDVLIVGAGPVGMLLAILLHDQGVSVRLVERQASLYPLPRAVAFDHESRRLFGIVGLNDEVAGLLEERNLKGGEDGQNFVWRDKDLKLVVDLHCEAPTRSGYPFGNNFNQPTLERLLEKTVLERGIPLVRGYECTSVTQYSDRVEAEFTEFHLDTKASTGIVVDGMVKGLDEEGSSDGEKSPPATIKSSGSYLIGADGANSTVRRLQKMTQTDLGFAEDWLIIDLLLRDGYVPPLVERIGAAQICDPDRPTTCIFAGKGRRRFEFMKVPGESRETLLADETLWKLLEPYGFTPDNVDLERKVIYTFNARWGNEFYKDRVVLAGDALHLMPPFIGQGLNSGFRDAGALAWRLPLLLNGVAQPAALLQSYQVERLNHVRKLTEYCVQLGEVICETDHKKSKAIHAKMRAAPPGRRYDPPLGRPGTLTEQDEAGKLSLHRKLNLSSEQQFFDKVNGYGWILLNLGDESSDSQLTGEARDFFVNTLGGKCVSVKASQDVSGEYAEWFASSLGLDHAVLVRPDFYVFGHSPVGSVNELVGELRTKMVSV